MRRNGKLAIKHFYSAREKKAKRANRNKRERTAFVWASSGAREFEHPVR